MTQASPSRLVDSFDGRDVYEVDLVSQTGVRLTFLNYAALIKDWQVPVEGQESRHVVCGFDQFRDYLEHSPYFGAIVGRVANRIGQSKFTLNGKEYVLPANEGVNQLHGGVKGLGKQVWDMQVIDDGVGGQAVSFQITSPDGEMGYPGNLTCTATYRLTDYRLRLDLQATSDAETPVSLVQHSYFNLMGDGRDIGDHQLWINADRALAVGSDNVPTGQILPVEGTNLDFTKTRLLKDENGTTLPVDNSLVLKKGRCEDDPVAILTSSDGALKLKLWTDQPSIHVYSGGGMDVKVQGLNGLNYKRHGAICLEDQNFPDAVNHADFPCSILKPTETYKHVCEIEIK